MSCMTRSSIAEVLITARVSSAVTLNVKAEVVGESKNEVCSSLKSSVDKVRSGLILALATEKWNNQAVMAWIDSWCYGNS